MKKSIFLFFAAILCAIGAKAFDQLAVDLYFDNSTSKWTECYVYIGHNRDKGWVSCYTMSRVSGTQYLWKLPANFNGGDKWGGATGWVVCKEKWWDSQEEDIYKFVYHGSKNVTNLTTTAWVNSKIYKADGTTTVDHYGQKPTVYKLTTSTKSDYKVTINTVEGGTLTVKDYDNNAVATGASKIHLTVLKFSATPADGYVLDGVEINDGTNTTTIAAADLASKTYTLTSAVTITPVWKAKDPLATEVYLAGEMNSWSTTANEFKKATADATSASVTVTLTAQTYKFKLVVGGAWKGNTGTMTRGGDAVHEGGWLFDKDGYDDNCKIVADIAGDYTFTWNLTDKKLTVEYPPLPKHQVTATVNPAETGEVTGTGEYEQGSVATLVATPAAGYAFKNWTVGGTEKSTEATYTFTVSEPISLVANFIPEVTHEVTVSYICNSNPIPGHDAQTLAVGVTTPSTITAPSITNYTFNGWTLGTGIQTEDDATDNPIHITAKAEGEYTLIANYTKIELTYTVKVPKGTEKCYIAGEMNSWSFQEMTPTANANEFTITIDGATTAHKYKYTCGEGWAYVEKKADGSDLDADRTYNANDVVAKWADVITYVLMGVNGDWTTGIPMIKDGEQYVCKDVTIDGGDDAVKAVTLTNGAATAWCGNVDSWSNAKYTTDKDGNIVLEDGIYDFYFKVSDDNIYISQTGYVRNVTNKYGTICLPYASASTTGAYFYEVAGKEEGKVYLASVDALAAGVPYIFEKTANQIKVVYTGEKTPTAASANGLVGTFTEITVPDGDYILYNNAFCTNEPAGTLNKIRANRAYLNMANVEGGVPQQMPGRRYIGMSVQGENGETGFENITVPAGKTVKAIVNGQLIIIRDGEMYNAQGVRF